MGGISVVALKSVVRHFTLFKKMRKFTALLELAEKKGDFHSYYHGYNEAIDVYNFFLPDREEILAIIKSNRELTEIELAQKILERLKHL